MNILALDIGTRMGWALLCNSLVKSGSVSFAAAKHAGYGVRFLNFHNWLVGMFSKHKIDMVVFEDVRNHIGVYAAHAYGGFMAQLTAVCEEHKIPYHGFAVKTIKKFITGSGNAGKDEIIQAMQNKGFRPLDDNEADALALLLLAESEIVEKGRDMNKLSNGQYRNNYKSNIRSEGREVENRRVKYSSNDHEVFAGPFKYSQVTGKLIAAPRYRQTFSHS